MKPKVLVVDDIEDIIAVVHKLLPGCEVADARTGAEAMKLAASLRPDLVILDVHLPDMSGVDIMEKFSAMPEPPVVIMLTGDDTVETAGKALAAGAFAYLTKPFEAKDLVELVIKALDFAEKQKAKRK